LKEERAGEAVGVPGPSQVTQEFRDCFFAQLLTFGKILVEGSNSPFPRPWSGRLSLRFRWVKGQTKGIIVFFPLPLPAGYRCHRLSIPGRREANWFVWLKRDSFSGSRL